MADFQLPTSGLAEDILGTFIEEAQQKADEESTSLKAEESSKVYHLVTFFLGREEYGLEIDQVQEIIRSLDITPVPGAPHHVRGVINLRGKIIPVIDLRKRFALPEAEESDASRIIVVEIGPKRLGMLVDAVSQVLKIPAAAVEALPEEAASIDEKCIRGVGKLENRLVVILDMSKTFLLQK